MSESELFDLGMKSIANDLPEQWKVYSEYTNGIKEHFLLGNIDHKCFVYIHESATAEVMLKPERGHMTKEGGMPIRLNMKLKLMIEDFNCVRIFDTFEKAKIWAINFMERYNKLYDTLSQSKKKEEA